MVKRGSGLRVATWTFHITLPLLGLWLVISKPRFDVQWENHTGHFWLVFSVALVNVILGVRISETARRQNDARLFLVALAFLASAGFLGLHALATPGVILHSTNAGFVVATPIGLIVAAVIAGVSAVEYGTTAASTLIRWQTRMRTALVLVLVAWGLASLAGLGFMHRSVDPRESSIAVLCAGGALLYAFAAVKYGLLYRRRRSVVLLSVTTAWVLLGEALIAVAYGRNWHASWWEWHILMALAFGFVAYSARMQFARERSGSALFGAVALEQTVQQVREEYSAALEEMVDALQQHEHAAGSEPVVASMDRLARQFGLTEGQRDVLTRAAESLASEREHNRRLDRLVEAGKQARVMKDEQALLDDSLALAMDAFPHDQMRLGLIQNQVLVLDPPGQDGAALEAVRMLGPVERSEDGAHVLALPLVVKTSAAGVLEVRRRDSDFGDRDRAVLETLAGQISVALENARLYRQMETLFRSYLSPDVATALIADPEQAALGGRVEQVTVLYADLRGFTNFSEQAAPADVVRMLNHYYGLVAPIVLGQGGTVVHYVGDALMAMWNAPVRQPDHAHRAARAALRMQETIGEETAHHPEWPVFRIGVNSGPALIGNIGAAEIRTYTAIGDTINLGARLEAAAPPGAVVIGPETRRLLGDAADVEPFGPLTVKGKARPVEAWLLEDLRADGADGAPPPVRRH